MFLDWFILIWKLIELILIHQDKGLGDCLHCRNDLKVPKQWHESMQMLLWWSIPSSKQTPILLFLYTPVKAQHTALIYELAKLVSARVYWSLIYGCQHSSFNVSWRHATLLWCWHVVSSLLLMEFGVTDLRGLWRRDCGIFFRQLQRKAGLFSRLAICAGQTFKNDDTSHFFKANAAIH